MGPRVPRFEAYESETITHTHTHTHSVDLPQLVVGLSTAYTAHNKHKTQHPCPPRDSNLRSQQGRPTPYTARPPASARDEIFE